LKAHHHRKKEEVDVTQEDQKGIDRGIIGRQEKGVESNTRKNNKRRDKSSRDKFLPKKKCIKKEIKDTNKMEEDMMMSAKIKEIREQEEEEERESDQSQPRRTRSETCSSFCFSNWSVCDNNDRNKRKGRNQEEQDKGINLKSCIRIIYWDEAKNKKSGSDNSNKQNDMDMSQEEGNRDEETILSWKQRDQQCHLSLTGERKGHGIKWNQDIQVEDLVSLETCVRLVRPQKQEGNEEASQSPCKLYFDLDLISSQEDEETGDEGEYENETWNEKEDSTTTTRKSTTRWVNPLDSASFHSPVSSFPCVTRTSFAQGPPSRCSGRTEMKPHEEEKNEERRRCLKDGIRSKKTPGENPGEKIELHRISILSEAKNIELYHVRGNKSYSEDQIPKKFSTSALNSSLSAKQEEATLKRLEAASSPAASDDEKREKEGMKHQREDESKRGGGKHDVDSINMTIQMSQKETQGHEHEKREYQEGMAEGVDIKIQEQRNEMSSRKDADENDDEYLTSARGILIEELENENDSCFSDAAPCNAPCNASCDVPCDTPCDTPCDAAGKDSDLKPEWESSWKMFKTQVTVDSTRSLSRFRINLIPTPFPGGAHSSMTMTNMAEKIGRRSNSLWIFAILIHVRRRRRQDMTCKGMTDMTMMMPLLLGNMMMSMKMMQNNNLVLREGIPGFKDAFLPHSSRSSVSVPPTRQPCDHLSHQHFLSEEEPKDT